MDYRTSDQRGILDRLSDEADDVMLKPRTRTILQTIRVIGSIGMVAIVFLGWTVDRHSYAGLRFLAFMAVGFPAAIATLIIIEDNWRRK